MVAVVKAGGESDFGHGQVGVAQEAFAAAQADMLHVIGRRFPRALLKNAEKLSARQAAHFSEMLTTGVTFKVLLHPDDGLGDPSRIDRNARLRRDIPARQKPHQGDEVAAGNGNMTDTRLLDFHIDLTCQRNDAVESLRIQMQKLFEVPWFASARLYFEKRPVGGRIRKLPHVDAE